MATYKRRIVYLSDSEWKALAKIAKRRKSTVSATLRDMILDPIRGEQMAWDVLKGKVVHHKDGTPNNDPDNLELRDA
jgi:macrodomain Ter protein organizer (MatP/YcbG family)